MTESRWKELHLGEVATMALLPQEDAMDDASSDLSTLSRTPSPFSASTSPTWLRRASDSTQLSSYPMSSEPSPIAEFGGISARDSSIEDDSGPPAKRRKIILHMPRSSTPSTATKEPIRLDLENPAEGQTDAKHIERVLSALRTRRKIVVVAGAGISVAAGIPDFRSSTGLFKTLRDTQKLKSSGQFLFDASVYKDAPSTTSFHDMLRQLCESTRSAQPTSFHHLLARISQEGRLLRLYTQNVDGIDTRLPPLATKIPLPLKGPYPKAIPVHGSLDKMVCTMCNKLFNMRPELFIGPIPPGCEECVELEEIRNVAGKRSHGVGRLRPRMVLYHEHNPDDEAIGAVSQADIRARPDAVIVVGTSLKIPGVRRIVKELCAVVRHRKDGLTVWINTDSDPPSSNRDCFDYVIRATSDTISQLVDLPHWDEVEPQVVTEEELEKVMSKNTPAVVVESPSKPKSGTMPILAPIPIRAPLGKSKAAKNKSTSQSTMKDYLKVSKDLSRPETPLKGVKL